MNSSLAANIIFAWGCDDLQLAALVRKPTEGETPPSGASWVRAVGHDGGSLLQIDDRVADLLLCSTAPRPARRGH
jgi:hypothetical protein